VLARDVRADRDLPPFDRAALDGYAVRSTGAFGAREVLPIAGEVAAGERAGAPLRPGSCKRIWTGAPVPRGAQGIVPVERAREENGHAVLEGPLAADSGRRQGIAERGEDARRGSVLLQRGRILTFGDLAVLAAVGHARVPVYAQPSVGILTTGHELVRPDQRPAPHQIRSTNDTVVAALAGAVGIERIDCLGRAEDREAPLRRALERGLARYEVLVVTGGVSAGRLDLVPGLLRELGVRIPLHKVAIRPGKPFLFGVGPATREERSSHGTRAPLRRRVVFGLPGNPMSVLATAVEFLMPFLRAWRGEPQPEERCVAARLRRPVRRGAGLLHFLPCRIVAGRDGALEVDILETHGSGDFVSASAAQGFARIQGDGVERPQGGLVRVDLLPGAQPVMEADS
jgi:molybdopterin molybdotransferase